MNKYYYLLIFNLFTSMIMCEIPQTSEKSIAIIGAGASGIAAATKLYENGFENLLIFEAENRIGGRVESIPFGDNYAEMGAQWVHGETGNVVFELAKKYDILDTQFELERMELRKSNGVKIDEEKAKRLTILAFSLIEMYHEEFLKFQGSFGYWMTIKLREVVSTDPAYNDIGLELVDQYLGFYGKLMKSYGAYESWFDVTPKQQSIFEDCPGITSWHWKDHGYKTILEILLKKFPDGSQSLPIEEKIHFNTTVTKIDWNGNGSTNVIIRCADGSSYNVDHVIVTVSLGVLKERHMGMFDPPLPERKRNAIETFQHGTVDKIFLEFSEAFWENNWIGLGILWTEKELDEIKRTAFDWVTDVLWFAADDYQSKVLVAWIGGASARRLELIPSDTIKEGMMFLLKKFLPDKKIPEPVRFLYTNWYRNPNFRGAYSSNQITSDLINATNADFGYPLDGYNKIMALQFAGEHTSENHFSTVHGAIETGWREAKRIIDLYK